MVNDKSKQVAVVLLFVILLEAQETTPEGTTVAAGTATTTEGAETTVVGTETTKNHSEPEPPLPEDVDGNHPQEGPEEAPPENGGDPYVMPGKHRPGPRHVRAHDGFHNLKREKHWAKWNDAFTTTLG
ncbi:hypothetical protein KR018_009976, partial [Drosophila ironensis]